MADLTTQILIEIRDEVRSTNARLDSTNARLDQTVGRLDQTVERLDRLEHRQAEAEIRMATGIAGVKGAIDELRDVLLEDRRLRRQVEDHERRIVAMERGGNG